MVAVDPIANLLSIIFNAYRAKKRMAQVPYSRIKKEILMIIQKEGFLEKVEVQGSKVAEKKITMQLKYHGKEPALTGIKRVSKPCRRVYARVDKIPPIRLGSGVTIVSTPSGLMTSKEAKKKNLGGEVICQIW